MKERNSYVSNKLEIDIKNITNNLKNIGYYNLEINSSLIQNNNNTVDLVYDINLGNVATIKNIKFIGNKIFKDSKLKKIIVTEEDKFWKFLSKNKFLSQRNIDLDKRLLENFYKNNGYYNVKIYDNFTEYLDKNYFEITYNISAGDKFYFNDLNIKVPAAFNTNDFKKIQKTLNSLKNKKYSYSAIQNILDEIEIISSLRNYEFINADISESIIDNNKIDIEISFIEDKKFYVGKIDIYGNNITTEKFIRNQLIVDEGDPLNLFLQNKFINNLKSKNIFKNVDYKIVDGDTADKKNIQLNVEEKPTGEIFAGAGVGTSGSSILFGIKENNYLGTGTVLNANMNIGSDNLTGIFSIDKPNFKDTENSLISSLESTKLNKLSTYGYDSSKIGFSVGTSYEQFTNTFFSPAISIYHETLSTNDNASNNLQKQEGSIFSSKFNYSLVKDLRNSTFQPNNGYLLRFNQSLPIYNNEAYSIKNNFGVTKYFEPVENLSNSISLNITSINSLNDKDVRISERIVLPDRNLRGFELGKVGPIDEGNYVGGNYSFAINYISDVPKIFENVENIDLNFFADIANVWGVDYSDAIDDSNKIRSSVGLGADWFTPIGPLTFTLAQAITKASSDKTETFRFNIGTNF